MRLVSEYDDDDIGGISKGNYLLDLESYNEKVQGRQQEGARGADY